MSNFGISTMRPISTLRKIEPQVTEAFRKGVLHAPTGPQAHMYGDSPHMVLLFTWLGAKERYAHKYIHSWTRRGFHVLRITTTVRDLLMPKTGTEVTASRLIEYLQQKEDFRLIVHGLSVGGYLGTRLIALGERHGTNLASRVSAQIFDSFTHINGIQAGVENAVPPKFHKIASLGTKLYNKYADLSIFYEVDDFMRHSTIELPALYMHSLADNVARFEVIKEIVKLRRRSYRGVSTLVIPECENIAHVALFRHLGEKPYMSSILRFLRMNNFPLRETLLSECEDQSLVSYEEHA